MYVALNRTTKIDNLLLIGIYINYAFLVNRYAASAFNRLRESSNTDIIYGCWTIWLINTRS